MGRYLYLGSYTTAGLQGVAAEGGTARREATEQLVASLGGELLEYGFTFGAFDFVVLAELPDEVAALAGPLLAGSSGAVRVQTVPLIPSERMDEARDRIADAAYRAPGAH